MAKKQHCPEFENHERWLVSFADMMTLLFAVFVVLYALKQGGGVKQEAIEQASSSIQENFNMIFEDIPIDRRVGPSEAGIGIFEYFKGNQARPTLIKKYPGSPERIRVIEDQLQKINMMIENRLYGPNLAPKGKGTGQERIVSVQRSDTGLRIQLLATHFFEPGEYKLRRQAMQDMDSLAKTLKEIGRPITIEGHTDSSPPKGEFTNWELSSLRASYIVRYLIRNQEFPPSMVNAAGYADTRPIADNSTESGRSLNRRIEIRINFDD